MNIFSKSWRVFVNKIKYRLGRRLYMSARGDIANNMMTNGELMIQKSVVKAVKNLTNEKLIFFDVGANIGDWSSELLSNYHASQYQALDLYLFEPVPSTAIVLRQRLGENEYLHYEILALSSEVGKDNIYLSGETAGTNSLHYGYNDTDNLIAINKTTVDEYCKQKGITTIHLFKCDTEGHDMEVISGALPLLEEGRIAILQFEYNHCWIFSRHYLKDVFDAIKDLPYRLGKICPNHVEVYDKWYPEHDRFFGANYVLLREDTLSWFDMRECGLDKNNTLAVI